MAVPDPPLYKISKTKRNDEIIYFVVHGSALMSNLDQSTITRRWI